MKTLTPKEISELNLKPDEAVIVLVSGGTLDESYIAHLQEFIRACRAGETPCGLIMENAVSISVVKAGELKGKAILLQEKE